jgi:hypothetical protein
MRSWLKRIMTYLEAQGQLQAGEQNWQLVLMNQQVFISSIGFFIIVGIPLAIAFIIFGIDLTGFADIRDIFGILRGPSDLLSKYLGLFLIVLSSFLFYIIMVALLGIYIFGGAVGVIGRSIREELRIQYRIFSKRQKAVFHLLGSSVIGIIFIIAARLGVGRGIAAVIIAQSDSTLALYWPFRPAL